MLTNLLGDMALEETQLSVLNSAVSIQNNVAISTRRKTWSSCADLPISTTNGGFIVGQRVSELIQDNKTFYISSASAVYNYSTEADGWIKIPNPTIAGTFGPGACGVYRDLGMLNGQQTNTAIDGDTLSISTNLTIVKSLNSCILEVVGGTGIGYTGTIVSNTYGEDSIIYVNTTFMGGFDSTTEFRIYSGSLWFFNPGSSGVGFSVYDLATNEWTAKSVTSLPSSWGTNGNLVSTEGHSSNRGAGFVSSTASSGDETTISDSTATWLPNGWTGSQVRIINGTGKGQIRAINSNSSTALTVSVAWDVIPDNTSVFKIEGNDNYLYLSGNSNVNLYRYDIDTDSWSLITPNVVRSGNPSVGASMFWADGVNDWSGPTYSYFYKTQLVKQQGRYIYSFRGSGGILDVYDIAHNAWHNDLLYGNRSLTIENNFSHFGDRSEIYSMSPTGELYKFNVENHNYEPLGKVPILQGTPVAGCKLFMMPNYYGEGMSNYLYVLNHSSTTFLRLLL